MYLFSGPVPPVIVPIAASSAIIHKLSGASVTLGFVIDNTSLVLHQTSNVVWTLEKDDGNMQTIVANSTGRHFFSPDFLSLTIDPLEDGDEGWYILTAYNEAGSGNGSIYLNIGSEYILTAYPTLIAGLILSLVYLLVQVLH